MVAQGVIFNVLLILLVFLLLLPGISPSTAIVSQPSLAMSAFAHHSNCARFVACERQLTLAHRRCTDRSRASIAGKCGLSGEFKELARLVEARLAHFDDCLLGRERNGSAGLLTNARECPAELDDVRESVGQQEAGACWLELGHLRKQCQTLQRCCASSKGCIRWLAHSEASLALRRQHQLINRKTLQCRANARQLAAAPKDPLPASNLKKTKVADGQPKTEQQVAIAADSSPSHQRVDFLEQLLRVLEQRAQAAAVPTWMARMAAKAGRPSQFMAEHQPRGIFPASRRVQQQRKAAAAVQQLVAHRQPQAFALPSNLDIRRLRLFAARPLLARTFGAVQQRRHNLLKAMREQLDILGATKAANAFGTKIARPEKPVHVDKAKKTVSSIQTWASATDAPHLTPSTFQVPTPPTTSPAAAPSSSTFLPPPVLQHSATSVQPSFTWAQRVFPQIWTQPTVAQPKWPITAAPAREMLEEQLARAETATTPLTRVESREMTCWKEIGKGEKRRNGKQNGRQLMTADVLVPFGIGAGKAHKSANEKWAPAAEKQPKADVKWARGRHAGESKPEKAKAQAARHRVEITLEGAKQRLVGQRGYRGRVLAAAVHAGLVKANEKPLHVPSPEIRRSPANLALSRLPIRLRTDKSELDQLRLALVVQLEKFLAEREPPRPEESLAMINRSRKESEKLGLGLDHCRLFSACQTHLRHLQSSQCSSLAEGRLVPGPPRRRSGPCNSRLLHLFERADVARAELERDTERCLAQELANGRQSTKPECPRDWPLLPPPAPQLDCPERVSLFHQHCRKLGRCCATLDSCKRQVDESELARRLRLEERLLARKSEQCQLQAHQAFLAIRERKRAQQAEGNRAAELEELRKRRRRMRI